MKFLPSEVFHFKNTLAAKFQHLWVILLIIKGMFTHTVYPHASLSLSKFIIVSMETDCLTREWVRNPFQLSNRPLLYTQCKLDGDGDRHGYGDGDGDGTCKQALRI